MASIVGREKELEILNKLCQSKKAEFLAIYGRRRIGKTYLISEFFKDKGLYFEVTGIPDASMKEQLSHFTTELSEKFYFGVPQTKCKNWNEAFTRLRHKIEELQHTKQKIVLFFDELPWLATKKSGLLQALEHFWNRYLSRMENVILIVCGSSASWMIKKIIHNKKGFYGRLTAEIRLLPFNLNETEQFLLTQGIDLNRKQITELYMAIGGIPKYLTYVSRGKSSAQIIQDLCFTQGAPLVSEFQKLYHSLFENPTVHIEIIEALSSKRYGLMRSEIAKSVGTKLSGRLTETLGELEAAGFIYYFPHFGKVKRDGRYLLIDEYSLFYLSWIKKAIERNMLNAPDYWVRTQDSSSFLSWAGYSFESVCTKHMKQIADRLGISASVSSYSSWRYVPSKRSHKEGAQIDLVIDRRDKCINLCEIKFSINEMLLSKNDAKTLEHKRSCFKEITKTNKTLFTTLITTYGVKENESYISSVHNQITMDSLFNR